MDRSLCTEIFAIMERVYFIDFILNMNYKNSCIFSIPNLFYSKNPRYNDTKRQVL